MSDPLEEAEDELVRQVTAGEIDEIEFYRRLREVRLEHRLKPDGEEPA